MRFLWHRKHKYALNTKQFWFELAFLTLFLLEFPNGTIRQNFDFNLRRDHKKKKFPMSVATMSWETIERRLAYAMSRKVQKKNSGGKGLSNGSK